MNVRFPYNRAGIIREGETAGECSVEFIGTQTKPMVRALSNILLVSRAVTPSDFCATHSCRHIMKGITGMNDR